MASRDREQMTIDIARRLPMILAACAFGILLSGCYGPVTKRGFINDIVVEVWASTSCTDPGNTVAMRATVVNNGKEAHTVELVDRAVFDLCVANPEYRKCLSDGKPLTPDLTRLELKPGGSKTIEMNWIAEAGSYGAVASYAYGAKFSTDLVTAFVDVGVRPYCPGTW